MAAGKGTGEWRRGGGQGGAGASNSGEGKPPQSGKGKPPQSGKGKKPPRWKELGTGELRILKPSSAQGSAGPAPPPRLVMRRQGILSVILNVRLFSKMTFTRAGEKALRFTCIDGPQDAEGGDGSNGAGDAEDAHEPIRAHVDGHVLDERHPVDAAQSTPQE